MFDPPREVVIKRKKQSGAVMIFEFEFHFAVSALIDILTMFFCEILSCNLPASLF